MAFNRTYYFNIISNNNISYRLEIYDQVETLLLDKEGTLGAAGVKIKYGSEGSKMYAPLKPSTLTIDMMVTDIDAASYIKNLKTNRQERDVYVGLYRETVSGTNDPIYGPMWGGYLLMDLSSDPDESLPYNIKLKCIDGLASLKHYDFIPDTLDQVPSGLYDKDETYISNSYPTHRDFINLISICLSKSGYFSTTQGSPSAPIFRTAVNWYNGEMANTTDDPLAKTRCKPNIFYEAETQGNDTIKYKAMNCYDVLIAICKAWGMRCFMWKNTWSFIQINQFEENQTGTQSNPDDIDNHRYDMGGGFISTSDTIEHWWGMYQLYVDNTQAASNVRNYKLSGGQYGTLPAFKQVTVDFLNVDNFNSFNGFPLIPLTSTIGQPTTPGELYEFTSLGNFTFDGTTDKIFYQRIYLAFTNNGTGSGDFSTEWCMVARPTGTGTDTANTSPVNNGWTKYMYFDYTAAPQSHAWAPASSLMWAAWPCTGQYPIAPGNQTIDITTGTPYQFPVMPASTFTAGDWEIGYYVKSVYITATTQQWSGHGYFNPTVYSANKNPWDYNIAYQNVAYGYGIGSSEFAPIISGAVGSYSTSTSLVQTGDDTADEKVNDILFGDGFGGRGTVQIYTGTTWKNSDASGIWGKDTLTGGNSMSQQLAQDIFAAQSKSLVEFTVATTLDPTESIYFNDGTANRPQFISPFTKIIFPSDSPSSTPTRAYIMHTGEWNVIQDTWKWKLYEQMQSLGSTTSTTTNTGGLNSGNTGGAGIPVPVGGGPVAKMGNPALNNTLNNKLLQQKQIAPITTITEAQIIAVSGATGTYQQTITSLKVNALEEVINQGDKFILQTQSVNPSSEPVNRIEFEASSRAMPGATTIPVTSLTIYQNIIIGDTISFNTSNLVSQYQNKTEGTIAGFDIGANGITKGGIEITNWLDSDTMAGATANNVPTAESVKAYVDASSGGGTALSVFSMLTCLSTTTTSDVNGAAAASVMKFDTESITYGTATEIVSYGSAGKTGIGNSSYSWELATSNQDRWFEMIWNVTSDTNIINNRILSAVNLQTGSAGVEGLTWADLNPTTSFIYDRGVGTIRKGSTSGSIIVKIPALTTTNFYRMIFWKEQSSNTSTKSISVLNGTQITIKQLK